MLTVTIDGNIIKEGDWVMAEMYETDTFVECRIHIQEELEDRNGDDCTKIYLCQNNHDGDSCNEENRYGFNYSWSALISTNGRLVSSDTFSIVPLSEKNVEDHVQDESEHEDEDVMPEDWVMDEIIPADL